MDGINKEAKWGAHLEKAPEQGGRKPGEKLNHRVLSGRVCWKDTEMETAA